jgi:hypothetical protein
MKILDLHSLIIFDRIEQIAKATLHIRNASNLGTGQTKLLRTD